MKSTIPLLTLIANYSWILLFTTPYSINAEFRGISNVHDAWNKYSLIALLNSFFNC